MVNCDFNLCIYNSCCKCSLEIITVSQTGTCNECILPDFPENVIEQLKADFLLKLEQRKNKNPPAELVDFLRRA